MELVGDQRHECEPLCLKPLTFGVGQASLSVSFLLSHERTCTIKQHISMKDRTSTRPNLLLPTPEIIVTIWSHLKKRCSPPVFLTLCGPAIPKTAMMSKEHIAPASWTKMNRTERMSENFPLQYQFSYSVLLSSFFALLKIARIADCGHLSLSTTISKKVCYPLIIECYVYTLV